MFDVYPTMNTMCAGKAFNKYSIAIRDALSKIFVKERTASNTVENKVIASVFGDTSMEAVMELQADHCKLLLETAPIPAKACVWETKALFNQRSCTSRQ